MIGEAIDDGPHFPTLDLIGLQMPKGRHNLDPQNAHELLAGLGAPRPGFLGGQEGLGQVFDCVGCQLLPASLHPLAVRVPSLA